MISRPNTLWLEVLVLAKTELIVVVGGGPVVLSPVPENTEAFNAVLPKTDVAELDKILLLKTDSSSLDCTPNVGLGFLIAVELELKGFENTFDSAVEDEGKVICPAVFDDDWLGGANRDG